MEFNIDNLEEFQVPYGFLERILEHFCPMPVCIRDLIENGQHDQLMMTEEQRIALTKYRNHIGRIYRVA